MFRQRIKQLRTEKGLKQEEVAELINVTHQTYQKWETGKTEPKVSQIQKLASVLGVNINGLFEKHEEDIDEETKNKIIETEKLTDDEKNTLNMMIEAMLIRHYSKKIKF